MHVYIYGCTRTHTYMYMDSQSCDSTHGQIDNVHTFAHISICICRTRIPIARKQSSQTCIIQKDDRSQLEHQVQAGKS